MAKESFSKESPVLEALKRLKEEEVDLLSKLKPVQEAIAALEKIVDKTVKKSKPASGLKENSTDNATTEDVLEDAHAEA